MSARTGIYGNYAWKMLDIESNLFGILPRGKFRLGKYFAKGTYRIDYNLKKIRYNTQYASEYKRFRKFYI